MKNLSAIFSSPDLSRRRFQTTLLAWGVTCLIGGTAALAAENDTVVELVEGAGQPETFTEQLAIALEPLGGAEAAALAFRVGDRLREKEGHPEAILAAYEVVITAPEADDDQVTHALLRGAGVLADEGSPGAALDWLDRYLERPVAFGPTWGAALLMRGDLQAFQMGDYQAARESYQRVFSVADEVRGSAGERREGDALARYRYVTTLAEGKTEFLIEPYVTLVDETSAQVAWVSDTAHADGRLVLPDLDQTHPSETEPVPEEEDFLFHRVRLEGLEPGAVIRYRVSSGDEIREGIFRTAVPAERGESFTFLVYGDSQDRPIFHEQVSSVMATEEADLVLHTGDLVGRGNRWSHWYGQFFRPARDLFSSTVIWPTYGNHDGGPFYPQLFTEDGTRYLTFRFGNAQFFSVQSHGSGSVGSGQRQRQLDWFREELEKSDAEWKFVFTHYPMISANPAGWSNWGREDFLPLMEEHGVNFVFTGHEHYYRRYPPMAGGERQPVIHITTGGAASVGGDIGYGGHGEPIPPFPLMVSGQRALHYCRVEVDGDHLKLTVLQRDGSVIDEVELFRNTDGEMRMIDRGPELGGIRQ